MGSLRLCSALLSRCLGAVVSLPRLSGLLPAASKMAAGWGLVFLCAAPRCREGAFLSSVPVFSLCLYLPSWRPGALCGWGVDSFTLREFPPPPLLGPAGPLGTAASAAADGADGEVLPASGAVRPAPGARACHHASATLEGRHVPVTGS